MQLINQTFKYFRLILPLLMLNTNVSFSFISTAECTKLIADGSTNKDFFSGKRWSESDKTSQERLAWTLSQDGFKKLKRDHIFGKDDNIKTVMLAILSETFGIFTGEPGSGKTYISKKIIDAELKSFSDEDMTAFVLQFDKMISSKKITGTPKLNEILRGRYELQTKGAISDRKFAYAIFDELEKANPATLVALLSVLNEKEIFMGRNVFKLAALKAGIATSNKSIAGIVETFDQEKERTSAEAMLDRLIQKVVVANHFEHEDKHFDYLSFIDRKNNLDKISEPILGLHYLTPMISKVKIPWPVIKKIAQFISEIDGQFTTSADQILEAIRAGDSEEREYFPASQFSNRTVLKIIHLLKANFLLAQLTDGVEYDQVRFEINNADLIHLQSGAILGGPGAITLKSFKSKATVRSSMNTLVRNTEVTIELHTGTGRFTDPATNNISTFKINTKTFTFENGFNLFPDRDTREKLLMNFEKEWHAKDANGVEAGKFAQFEDDGVLDRYLDESKPDYLLTKEARRELLTVQKERNIFIAQLNSIILSPEPNWIIGMNSTVSHIKTDPIKLRLRELDNRTNLSEIEKQEQAWLQAQLFYKKTNTDYFESSYVIEEIMAGILSRSHVLIFGPAGGAKTSLARHVLEAELRGLKIDRSDNELAIFFQQFHKLLPAGIISGMEKIDEQLKTGEISYEEYSSLVHRDFAFAILDEVEKGNPAVISKLLSILNERSIFRGDSVVPSGLIMAVLTSNKTPAEFIEMFGKDPDIAYAFLDRCLSKVYVSNKFSSPELLAQFILNYEMGIEEKLKQNESEVDANILLRMEQLRPLIDQVNYANDHVKRVALRTSRRYISKRLKATEDSRDKHSQSKVDEPFVYERKMSESDRTSQAIFFSKVKAAFILDQLVRGVPFKQIRTKIEYEDLHTLGKALVYGGPWYIEKTSKDGVLQFKGMQKMEELIRRDYVNARNKAILSQIQNELEDFLSVLNEVLIESHVEIKRVTSTLAGQFFDDLKNLLRPPKEPTTDKDD